MKKRERVFRSWSGPKAWLIVPEHVGFVYNSVLCCIRTHKLDLRSRVCACVCVCVCPSSADCIWVDGSLSIVCTHNGLEARLRWPHSPGIIPVNSEQPN